MMTTTVRISEHTRDVLRELAQAAGISIQEVLEQAVEAYRRQRLLAEANAAYAALRSDPQAWQDWQEEVAAWDVTLADSQRWGLVTPRTMTQVEEILRAMMDL